MVVSAAAITSIAIVAFALLHIALYKLFKRAGFTGWWAFIPLLNISICLRITGRPQYWLVLMFLPVIGFLFIMITFFDLLFAFGKQRFYHFLLGMVFGVFYLFWQAVFGGLVYEGPRKPYQRHAHIMREWAEAIILAIILVSAYIKPFWFETYNIPSQSMEGTLIIGDYILVSKFNYGPRLPITPIAVPFVHNTIGNGESYWKGLQLPYLRLPGVGKIQRGDVVVFNYPYDDRPVDRQTNYIKRCIAAPGDTLAIQDKLVLINGKPQEIPPFAQFDYMVKLKNPAQPEYFAAKGYIDASPINDVSTYLLTLSPDKVNELRKLPLVDSVWIAESVNNEDIFPQDTQHPWARDMFGPLYIPKRGHTIKLTEQNIRLYERVIRVYEGNDLRINGPYFKLNGKNVNSYTFKQDYYFMMGDNRDKSSDSRFWGFVPEDHVVGKAWFIWMSFDENRNFRTSRFFKAIE